MNPRCCQLLVDQERKLRIAWPLFVEKAIAKEYGGYDNLNGGAIDYALMFMTGQPAFRYNLLNEEVQLRIADNSLWLKMLDFVGKGFLLGAGTLPKEEIPKAYEKIAGTHAYAILDAFEVDGHKLLKLRDPRGLSDWMGEWCSTSERWTARIKEMVIKHMQDRKSVQRVGGDIWLNKPMIQPSSSSPVPRDQRTFFVSWEEFTKCFEVIFVSILFDETWDSTSIFDAWEKGRAGGSTLYTQSVINSPQYLLTVDARMEIFCLLVHLVPASMTSIGAGAKFA